MTDLLDRPGPDPLPSEPAYPNIYGVRQSGVGSQMGQAVRGGFGSDEPYEPPLWAQSPVWSSEQMQALRAQAPAPQGEPQAGYAANDFPIRMTAPNPFEPGAAMPPLIEGLPEPVAVMAGLQPGEQRGGYIEGPMGFKIATAPVSFANLESWTREGAAALFSYYMLDGAYQRDINDQFGVDTVYQGPEDLSFQQSVLKGYLEARKTIGDSAWTVVEVLSREARRQDAYFRLLQVRDLISKGQAPAFIGGRGIVSAFTTYLTDPIMGEASRYSIDGIIQTANERGVDPMTAIASLYDLPLEVVVAVATDPNVGDEYLQNLSKGPDGNGLSFSTDPMTNLIVEGGWMITIAAGGLVGAKSAAGFGSGFARGIAPTASSAFSAGYRGALRGSPTIAQQAIRTAGWTTKKAIQFETLQTGAGWTTRGLEWGIKQAALILDNQELVALMDNLMYENPWAYNPGLNLMDAFSFQPIRAIKPLLGRGGADRMFNVGTPGTPGHIGSFNLSKGEWVRPTTPSGALDTAALAAFKGGDSDIEVIIHGERVKLPKDHPQVVLIDKIRVMNEDDLLSTVLRETGWEKDWIVQTFGDGNPYGLTYDHLKGFIVYGYGQAVRSMPGSSVPFQYAVGSAREASNAFFRESAPEILRLFDEDVTGKASHLGEAIRGQWWELGQITDSKMASTKARLYSEYSPAVAFENAKHWIIASEVLNRALREGKDVGSYVPGYSRTINRQYLKDFRARIVRLYNDPDAIIPDEEVQRFRSRTGLVEAFDSRLKEKHEWTQREFLELIDRIDEAGVDPKNKKVLFTDGSDSGVAVREVDLPDSELVWTDDAFPIHARALGISLEHVILIERVLKEGGKSTNPPPTSLLAALTEKNNVRFPKGFGAADPEDAWKAITDWYSEALDIARSSNFEIRVPLLEFRGMMDALLSEGMLNEPVGYQASRAAARMAAEAMNRPINKVVDPGAAISRHRNALIALRQVARDVQTHLASPLRRGRVVTTTAENVPNYVATPEVAGLVQRLAQLAVHIKENPGNILVVGATERALITDLSVHPLLKAQELLRLDWSTAPEEIQALTRGLSKDIDGRQMAADLANELAPITDAEPTASVPARLAQLADDVDGYMRRTQELAGEVVDTQRWFDTVQGRPSPELIGLDERIAYSPDVSLDDPLDNAILASRTEQGARIAGVQRTVSRQRAALNDIEGQLAQAETEAAMQVRQTGEYVWETANREVDGKLKPIRHKGSEAAAREALGPIARQLHEETGLAYSIHTVRNAQGTIKYRELRQGVRTLREEDLAGVEPLTGREGAIETTMREGNVEESQRLNDIQEQRNAEAGTGGRSEEFARMREEMEAQQQTSAARSGQAHMSEPGMRADYATVEGAYAKTQVPEVRGAAKGGLPLEDLEAALKRVADEDGQVISDADMAALREVFIRSMPDDTRPVPPDEVGTVPMEEAARPAEPVEGGIDITDGGPDGGKLTEEFKAIKDGEIFRLSDGTYGVKAFGSYLPGDSMAEAVVLRKLYKKGKTRYMVSNEEWDQMVAEAQKKLGPIGGGADALPPEEFQRIVGEYNKALADARAAADEGVELPPPTDPITGETITGLTAAHVAKSLEDRLRKFRIDQDALRRWETQGEGLFGDQPTVIPAEAMTPAQLGEELTRILSGELGPRPEAMRSGHYIALRAAMSDIELGTLTGKKAERQLELARKAVAERMETRVPVEAAAKEPQPGPRVFRDSAPAEIKAAAKANPDRIVVNKNGVGFYIADDGRLAELKGMRDKDISARIKELDEAETVTRKAAVREGGTPDNVVLKGARWMLERTPEGPAKERLQETIDRVRQLDEEAEASYKREDVGVREVQERVARASAAEQELYEALDAAYTSTLGPIDQLTTPELYAIWARMADQEYQQRPKKADKTWKKDRDQAAKKAAQQEPGPVHEVEGGWSFTKAEGDDGQVYRTESSARGARKQNLAKYEAQAKFVRENLRKLGIERIEDVDQFQLKVTDDGTPIWTRKTKTITGGTTSFPDPLDETKRIDATYELRSIDELVTSADEGYDPALQPRGRGARVTSDEQIDEIAKKFDPDLSLRTESGVDGPALVDPKTGMTLTANGRTQAMRRMSQEKWDAYRARLMERAGEFGLEPGDIGERMVLVRVVGEEVVTPTYAKAFNPTGMSQAEMAVAVGRLITPEDIGELNLGENVVLREALKDPKRRPFVERVLGDLTPAEKRQYMDAKGNISDAGTQLVEQAILSKVLGDPQVVARLIESPEEGARFRKGLEMALGQLLKGEANTTDRIGPVLADALQQIMVKMSSGMNLRDIAADFQTTGMFADAAVAIPEQVRELGAILTSLRSQAEVASFLRRYGDITGEPTVGMFDEGAPALHQRVNLAVDALENIRKRDTELKGKQWSQDDGIPRMSAPDGRVHTVTQEPTGASAHVEVKPDDPIIEETITTAERVYVDDLDQPPQSNAPHIYRAKNATEAELISSLKESGTNVTEQVRAIGAEVAPLMDDAEGFGNWMEQALAAVNGTSPSRHHRGVWYLVLRNITGSDRWVNGKYQPVYEWPINRAWKRTTVSDQIAMARLLDEVEVQGGGTSARPTDVVVTGTKARELAGDFEEVTGIKDTEPPKVAAIEEAGEGGAPVVVRQADAAAQRAAQNKASTGAGRRDSVVILHEINETRRAQAIAVRVERLRAQREGMAARLADSERRLQELDPTDAEPGVVLPADIDALYRRYVFDQLALGDNGGIAASGPTTIREVLDTIHSLDLEVPERPGQTLNAEELVRLRQGLIDFADAKLRERGAGDLDDMLTPENLARMGIDVIDEAEPGPGPVARDPTQHDTLLAELNRRIADRIVAADEPIDGYAGVGYEFRQPPRRQPGSPTLYYTHELTEELAKYDRIVPGLGVELTEGRQATRATQVARAADDEAGRRLSDNRILRLLDTAFGPRPQKDIESATIRRFAADIGKGLSEEEQALLGRGLIKHLHRKMQEHKTGPLPFGVYRRIGHLRVDLLETWAKEYMTGRKKYKPIYAQLVAESKTGTPIWDAYRKADNRIRAYFAERPGGLADYIDSIYETGGVRRMAQPMAGLNVLYSMARFFFDARWLAMDVIEAPILLLGREGPGAVWDAIQKGRGAKETRLLFDQSGETAKQLMDRYAWWMEMGDAGGYFRWRNSSLVTMVERGQARGLVQELEHMARQDPTLAKMIADSGDTPLEYLKKLDRDWRIAAARDVKLAPDEMRKMLEPYVADGVVTPAELEAFVKAGRWVHHPELEKAIAQADTPALRALYRRQEVITQQAWQDAANVVFGQSDRSNFQRLLNSPLLYWPISYQIKATKWLYSMLFDRFLGYETGAAPAAIFDMIIKEHGRKLAEDEDFQNFLKDNKNVLFMAQMLLPITPWDIGISLSPFTRLFVSMLMDEPEDAYQRNLFSVGPGYSYYSLFPRVLKELSEGDTPVVSDVAERLRYVFPLNYNVPVKGDTTRNRQDQVTPPASWVPQEQPQPATRFGP